MRVIKRYDNRKLYDPQGRRYVTLGELGGLVGRGVELRVQDQKTGEDVTSVMLAQVILERIRERSSRIPRQLLSRLIRLGSAPAWREWQGPQQAAARAREEAERIVSGLLGRGRLSLEEGLHLRQDIAHAVQDIVAETQRGLTQRIHGLLERNAKQPGVHPALEQFEQRLLAFEASLVEEPQPGRTHAGRARRGRRRKSAR